MPSTPTPPQTTVAPKYSGLGHQWRLTDRVTDGWEAILERCHTARESIYIEQFVLLPDEIGGRLMRLLTAKARDGLTVRLIIDTFGSHRILKSGLLPLFRAAGGELRIYRPKAERAWMPPLLPRNHRKLIIVDRRTAFVGGICFDDMMRHWRDLLTEIEGPVVRQICADFLNIWSRLGRDLATQSSSRFGTVGGFSYVSGRGRHGAPQKDTIRYLSAARRCICLMTPYFFPTPAVWTALRAAAIRGVDVRIVMPAKSNHFWADLTAKAYLAPLCRAGVRLSLHPEMLHTKLLVIDHVGMIGSLNCDVLSQSINLECALVSTNPRFVEALRTYVTDQVKD